MRRFGKWLSLLSGLIVALAAFPALAGPQKLYLLNICVGTFDASGVCQVAQNPGGNKTIQARVFNDSPPQTTNSSINSFDLRITNKRPWQGTNFQVLPPHSGQVFQDVSTGLIRVSNLDPIKPQDSVVLQFTIDGFSCGEGVWDVTPYTGSNFSGATFSPGTGFVPPKTEVVCGNVNCGGDLTVQASAGTSSTDTSFVVLKRGAFNQDGTTVGTTADACSALAVFVTPTSPTVTPSIVRTDWDATQPDADVALFRYTVNLNSSSTTTPPPIQVAWRLKVDGSFDFQNVLACEPKSPDLPQLYGTVAADNGGKIQVNLAVSSLPGVPFPITIDNDRMVVTKVISSTSTWFVTRSVSSPTHDPGANVLSTPLPVIQSTDGYPTSYVGTVAKMCKLSGPTLNGIITNGANWSVTIIDGADGVVKGTF